MKDQLQELLHRKPFVAFTIIMIAGQKYEVPNPRLVALGASQITVYVPRSDKNHILRLNQIASFHVSQAA